MLIIGHLHTMVTSVAMPNLVQIRKSKCRKFKCLARGLTESR